MLRNNPVPGEKLGEKLERFLETLPLEDGFVFGVPERLAVEELLLALVRRGEFPEDPRELKSAGSVVLRGPGAAGAVLR